jgi:hypothetical protein
MGRGGRNRQITPIRKDKTDDYQKTTKKKAQKKTIGTKIASVKLLKTDAQSADSVKRLGDFY